MSRTRAGAGGYLRHVRLAPDSASGRYQFTLHVVRRLAAIEHPALDAVTCLVGDNGTGKSTRVEAVAVAAGFNAEGGTQSFRFVTRPSESSLGEHLILLQGTRSRRSCASRDRGLSR